MKTLLLLAAVAAVAAAGCGDDEPTEAEFRKEANALCARERAAQLRTPLPTTEEDEKAFDEAVAKSNKRLYDELGELDAPDAIAKRVDRAVDRGPGDETGRELTDLGLIPCASVGVWAFAGGDLYGDEIERLCAASVREMQREVDLEKPGTAAPAADELRVLADGVEQATEPPEAAEAEKAAVAGLRATAKGLDVVARGRPATEELQQAARRGFAAMVLLSVPSCNEVYETLR